MLSSAGCEPTTGNDILMRPENPAPFTELIANWSSLVSKPQELESITKVNSPSKLTRLVIVNGIAVGVGV
jgi:hypothetical protein